MSDLFLIYSEKRQMYWRPGGLGYTGKKADAGRFDDAAVERICRSEDRHPIKFSDAPVESQKYVLPKSAASGG